ncbi:hypothetical protein [Aurantiacibacter sp. MUD61]|uniref:hypothetical protein n=1 Tax=Aurantiacibacter sp. MUD61 TaxID=3009083 RepID=UPI0022F041B3|nr:hypothetical protein [Aurantiacibacter sp. MUD61]
MKIVSALAAAAFTVALPSAAQSQEAPSAASETIEMQLAHQILDTAYPEDVREPMFMAVSEQMEQQVMASVMQQVGDAPAGARAVIREWQASITSEQREILRRHVPSLMQAWAVSYASIFSEEELRDILAFVQTDSGASFMLRTNDVISDPAFATANQAYINETMALMLERMPDLIQGLVAASETD